MVFKIFKDMFGDQKKVKKPKKKKQIKKSPRKKVAKKKVSKNKVKKTKRKLANTKKTSKKKIVKKKKTTKKKATKKKQPKKIKEKEAGIVTHYFGKIKVGIIKLKSSLRVGDKIQIKGAHVDFSQVIKSMQVNHENVSSAKKNAEIGIKVKKKVHPNDKVYKK
jgi:hypothetical protein